MDQCTHEVRRQHWKNIIAQCNQRPEGQTAKQWLDAMVSASRLTIAGNV